MVNALNSTLTLLSGGNETLAAAMFLAASGLVSWVAFKLPRKIIAVIRRRVLASVTIEDTMTNEAGFEYLVTEVMVNCIATRQFNISRTFTREPFKLGAGLGTHVTRIDGCWAIGNVLALDSSGVNKEKKRLTITYFSRNTHIPEYLRQLASTKVTAITKAISVYVLNRSGLRNPWVPAGRIPYLEGDRLVLNASTMEKLNAIFKSFSDRATADKLGLSRKKTILLEGPPGTSKTTTIRALAARHKMPLYIIDLSIADNESLSSAMSLVPSGAVVAIEDIDSISAARQRDTGLMGNDASLIIKDQGSLTTAGLLNVLDGTLALNDFIVVMTTNHVEVLDNALLRAGRTDAILHLGGLTPEAYVPYLNRLYGQEFDTSGLPQIKACDLFSIVGQYGMEHGAVMRALKQRHTSLL